MNRQATHNTQATIEFEPDWTHIGSLTHLSEYIDDCRINQVGWYECGGGSVILVTPYEPSYGTYLLRSFSTDPRPAMRMALNLPNVEG